MLALTIPQPNSNAAATSGSVATLKPPLVGSADADAEGLALADAEALAVALALALALALAVAVALAPPPPVAPPPEPAPSKFSPPRSPPALVSVGAAEAAGPNANTTTRHNEVSNNSLLIRPLSKRSPSRTSAVPCIR